MPDKTILYVEDDANNQMLIRYFFRNEPYEIISAECPDDAMKILTSQNCDIIMVDLNLQNDGDGAELIRSIRSLPDYKNVPVFVFSGFDESHFQQYQLDGLIQRYFRKPASKQNLIDVVREFDETAQKQN